MVHECVICKSVNHVYRFTCQNCGTIPAKYSVARVPTVHRVTVDGDITATEIVVARGAVRAAQHHQRLFLRTVAHDYYASE